MVNGGASVNAFGSRGRTALDCALQKQQEAKLRTYAPRQTPTMIVNGKYKIQTGPQVPSYEEMLKVVDYLVAQERAAMTASAE